ncbi:putative PH domain protein, partial [Toxoplasma gondii MAS]
KPDKGYFCSELVASALKEIGALPEDTHCARYWPHNFAAGSALKLNEGFELDEELLVDFCLRSRPRKHRGHRVKEGRTVPSPTATPQIEELSDSDSRPFPPSRSGNGKGSFLGSVGDVETEALRTETPETPEGAHASEHKTDEREAV